VAARDTSVQEASQLRGELAKLREQLGALAEHVKENERAQLTEQLLKRQWCIMYRELATQASTALQRLGAHDFHTLGSLEANEDATFLQLFNLIVEAVERAVTRMNDIMVNECSDLLRNAVAAIFSNLYHAAKLVGELLDLYSRTVPGKVPDKAGASSGAVPDEDAEDSSSAARTCRF
jgi:hypothetical protein